MSDRDEKQIDPPSEGYETRDANVKRIALVGLVSIIILVFSIILVDQYFMIYKEKLIDEVVLQPESAALRDLRAREDEALNSYRILDAAKGVYQIPIGRAMQLVADEAYRVKTGALGEQ